MKIVGCLSNFTLGYNLPPESSLCYNLVSKLINYMEFFQRLTY